MTDAVQVRIQEDVLAMMDPIAPGVVGYTMERPEALYIPFIQAVREGSGDVGRFLNSLPMTQTIRVPNVVSSRLEGMLKRRGFVLIWEWSEVFEEQVAVWERKGI